MLLHFMQNMDGRKNTFNVLKDNDASLSLAKS